MSPRRVDRRYPRELSVEWTWEGTRHIGRSRNVSFGGMFLATKLPMPHGARVAVRFTLPTQPEPVEVMAEVRWIAEASSPDGAGLGMRFDGLRARDVWALNRFFEHAEEEAGGR